MRGQGFGIASSEAFAPDAERTQLIASKFSNARIRELFPWWWWCCDDPNIVFSVTQNGNVILNENPATSTRWCFEDGSSVSLVGIRTPAPCAIRTVRLSTALPGRTWATTSKWPT